RNSGFRAWPYLLPCSSSLWWDCLCRVATPCLSIYREWPLPHPERPGGLARRLHRTRRILSISGVMHMPLLRPAVVCVVSAGLLATSVPAFAQEQRDAHPTFVGEMSGFQETPGTATLAKGFA